MVADQRKPGSTRAPSPAALVLLSGGMDSTIALYHTLARKRAGELRTVHALTFDYAQRHQREVQIARGLWSQLQPAPGRHETLWVGGMMPRTGSLMTEQDVREYDLATISADAGHDDPAFIPHRNLFFLTVAAMWATQFDANEIVTGIRGGFPDCTPQFEADLMHVLDTSNPEHKLRVHSPLHMSRRLSLKLAKSLPGCWEALAYTMTCFKGLAPPCGRCLPCVRRAQGFAEFGESDPLIARYDAMTERR